MQEDCLVRTYINFQVDSKEKVLTDRMQSILEQYAKSLSFDSSKWNFRTSKRDNDEIFGDLDHLHVMLVSY